MSLEVLNLSQTDIGDEGAIALAGNTSWKKILSFCIHSNPGITEKGKAVLQSNPLFESKLDV